MKAVQSKNPDVEPEDEDHPFKVSELPKVAPWWSRLFGEQATYRAINAADGGPRLKAVRVGRKIFVTRRALKAFLRDRENWNAANENGAGK